MPWSIEWLCACCRESQRLWNWIRTFAIGIKTTRRRRSEDFHFILDGFHFDGWFASSWSLSWYVIFYQTDIQNTHTCYMEYHMKWCIHYAANCSYRKFNKPKNLSYLIIFKVIVKTQSSHKELSFPMRKMIIERTGYKSPAIIIQVKNK